MMQLSNGAPQQACCRWRSQSTCQSVGVTAAALWALHSPCTLVTLSKLSCGYLSYDGVGAAVPAHADHRPGCRYNDTNLLQHYEALAVQLTGLQLRDMAPYPV